MRRGDGGRSVRWRLRVSAAVVISIAASFATPPAAAHGRTTASGNDHAKRTLVSVKVAGDGPSTNAVLDVLRERIGAVEAEASFEVVPAIDRASIVTPGPPDDRQLARIWIDLTEPPGRKGEREPVTLYVVDGSWERVLVRPVARQLNPEVTWEEIGHIVELALGALRAGESIGVGRAVAREQLLPPEPSPGPDFDDSKLPPELMYYPPRPAPEIHPRIGAFYATTAYGSTLELSSGPGVIFDLHVRHQNLVRGKLELGVTFSGEYRFASTVDRGSALVRFEGASFHAQASAGYSFTARHHLIFGIGGGADLVHARGQSPQRTNIRFVDGNVDPIPAARVLVRYGLVMPNARVFAGLGLDLPFRNPRYLLSRENEPVILFEPWVVRPFLMVGLETK